MFLGLPPDFFKSPNLAPTGMQMIALVLFVHCLYEYSFFDWEERIGVMKEELDNFHYQLR